MNSKYFYASILVSHAGFWSDGFRQREVRFYMDFFSNWVFVKVNSEPFPLHNTQIMRSLQNMVRLGLVKRMGRQNPPRYRLTRAGLIQTLKNLISLPLSDSYSDFFFVYQFLINYKSEIMTAAKDDLKNISRPTYLEMKYLLDEKKFIQKQIDLVNHEIRNTKELILDSEKSISSFYEMKSKKIETDEIVKILDKKYPYELNSRKRLAQIMRQLPKYWRESEVSEKNKTRVDFYWKPKLQHLESYGQILKQLE